VTLVLTLRARPAAPVDAEGIRPDALGALRRADIERLELFHGNRATPLAELFTVSGDGEPDVRVEGDLARVARLGAGMASGRLVIAGSAGAHAGAGMRNGELVVEGDAGDWVGAAMRGGRIVVHGAAGHRLGGAYAGSRAGMRGGEILVHGDAGEEAGAGLRRGLIAVAGRCGAAAGLSALAGTIVALGGCGRHAGAGMRRASLVTMAATTLLDSYSFACVYRPPFVGLCLRRLRSLGLPVAEAHIEGRYARWSGDTLELGRGEILILETDT
jgi:formylmethanofuran dehydrogenase subunit C